MKAFSSKLITFANKQEKESFIAIELICPCATNSNQVVAWPRPYTLGLLGEGHSATVKLLPVHVREAQASTAHRSGRPAAKRRDTTSAGAIRMEFPKAHLCSIDCVDAETLRTVLEQANYGSALGCATTVTRDLL